MCSFLLEANHTELQLILFLLQVILDQHETLG